MVRTSSSAVKTAFRREIGKTLKREFKITDRQFATFFEIIYKFLGEILGNPKVRIKEKVNIFSVKTNFYSSKIPETKQKAIANSIMAMADVGFSSDNIVSYIHSYYRIGEYNDPDNKKIQNANDIEPVSPEKKIVSSTDDSKTDDLRTVEQLNSSDLKKFVVETPIESWAGYVLKAGEIREKFGIPTSTLHSWRETNKIVAIKRNHRNFCYPIEQFVDSKPVAGIEDILKLSPSSRSAWLWLCQRHPTTKDMRPIDLLRNGDAQVVVDAAHGEFGCRANG
ncbi:hypothetical protein K6L44_07785 [Gluconacetobacter entanii]|uniref:antitoxin Xre/MbcA/ParS-like domain-containing protein n=1 Tax=Gluconacetobacter entanii TaxID=108528 RepID=UPI001C9326EC|nr:hypothetical protein [Gluconacetobacter entanii]MBY4639889.1 hypothetical protein [Gluconacetobacter entanii]MCW4579751.1 hypothetical protein [Gluconacetobacter entanii]MCW4583157.1 hypothetical protein [Gluconacetobacter entanii]MCW4586547.1 hypothetical protein [Gluconacetobacter entanii]